MSRLKVTPVGVASSPRMLQIVVAARIGVVHGDANGDERAAEVIVAGYVVVRIVVVQIDLQVRFGFVAGLAAPVVLLAAAAGAGFVLIGVISWAKFWLSEIRIDVWSLFIVRGFVLLMVENFEVQFIFFYLWLACAVCEYGGLFCDEFSKA